MSFYTHEQAMRSSGDAMSLQGSADASKAHDADSLNAVHEDHSNIHPAKRLGSLIQQYSRNPSQFQRQFWRHQMNLVENGFDSDGKAIDFFNLGSAPSGNSSALPLARIKKVMKNDDEVKVRMSMSSNFWQMISAEAPILFSRACESTSLHLCTLFL